MSEFAFKAHQMYLAKYLKRLPEHVDCMRLTTLYFAVSGIDLLGGIQTEIPDPQPFIHWIYSLQAPTGGFRVGPCLAGFGKYDYATLASTYSALCLLQILGDDLANVDRVAMAEFLKDCQREDGNFRSHPGSSEADVRFLYCACAISEFTQDWNGIDKAKATEFVLLSKSFEGGIGLEPGFEAHGTDNLGGSTYCSLSSLTLMGTLSQLPDKEQVIEWLLSRQCGGIQGRVNKVPDTCYGFWIGGSLALLDAIEFLNIEDSYEFYKDCENQAGGFRKNSELRPDIVHTYYSLAYLSLAKQPGLKALDARLGIASFIV